jgi:hypothetical protein
MGSWKTKCLFRLVSLIAFFLMPCTGQAGLLAHWTFDETPGATQVVDAAGGLVGTLSATGAALVSGGRDGGALSLDQGTGGYVTMGDVLSLGTGPYSFVVWVQTSTQASDSIVMAKHSSGVVAGYLIGVNEGNTYGAPDKAWFYNVSPGDSPTSTTSVNDGQWHQIAGVRGDGLVQIYVDGLPVENSKDDQGLNNPPAGTPFLVGGISSGGTPVAYYTGLVDDIQVYDHALPDSEVQWLFDHPGRAVCASATDGMVSWWKGEGNASDFAGSNNGTLAGGVGFADGKIGQAFSFDGADDYVDVPALTTSNFPAAFTIGGWVKVNTLPGDIAVLAGMPGAYQLDVRSTGVVTFGNSGAMVDSISALAAGSWYHVAATFESENINIYINGVLDKAGTTTTYAGEERPFQIGGFGGYGGFFNGLIDELVVSNRALTADEILAIYEAGVGGICGEFDDIPGLRLWLKPDSGLTLSGTDSVSAWEDRSGNGLDVAQATGTNQPARVSANLNGLPVVRFDGIDDYLRRSAVPGYDLFDNSTDTVYIVQKQAGTDPRTTTFSWTPDGINRFMVHATWDNVIYFQATSYTTGGNMLAAPQPYGWDDRWHVLKLVKDGSSGQINVDGIDLTLTETTSSAGNNSPTADLYVGSDWSSTNWFTGDIAEILVFSRALTTEEQQDVDTYLRGKYGLTSTPDAFAIPDKIAQPLNSLIESDPITVAGISLLAPISISAGGEYAINSGAYTADLGIVVNGDSITVRQTSSGSYGTATDVTLTIGGVTDTFTVTTLHAYTVTANAGGNGSGTVASDAGGISYSYPTENTGTTSPLAEGSSITLKATAGTGSTAAWSDCAASGGTPTADTCSFAGLDGDKTATATFTLNQYTLTYTAGEHGSISGLTPQTVDHGSDGTPVTAVADANYHFVQWSDGATANPRTDTNVTGDIAVTASFAIDQYTLTYAAGEHGSISGTTPQTVDHGSDGTPVTAVPETGYHFVQWSDGATSNPRTDTNVTGDISVTASFAIDQYPLTVTLAGSGQGTVRSDPAGIDCETDCSGTFDYGTVVTLTATAAAGSRFAGWTGDADCADGMVTITGDVSCTATFSPYFPWILFNTILTGSAER